LGACVTTRPVQGEPRGITWKAGRNSLESYAGWTSLVHIGALGATSVLVQTGVDAEVQSWAARQDETMSTVLGVPGLAGGALLPVLLPGGMYLFSDDPDVIQGAAAASQSVILAFLANTLLKAVTGRTPPDRDHSGDVSVEERSRAFRPGFLRGGVFDGWPSGHSMVNMALAASLASYFNDSPWVQIVAYGWAAYVMASVTFGAQGNVHWLSDAVAGGAMGLCIGWTIGHNFASNRLPAGKAPADSVQMVLSPALIPGGSGLQLMLVW
jgi:hypothetical protein